MKRLIVCCDGTWNNPGQEENGIPAPTNVFKIYNAIADQDSQSIGQLKYYHPGVGGEGGLVQSITGGAVGVGISRHICSAYHWLGQNYEEGDEIYLFGFSRGAFTVRSLAGFLGHGLLDLHGLDVNDAWERVHTAYHKGYQVKGARQEDWAEDWTFFHQQIGQEAEAPPIHFIGVWDTVGALGVPDDLEILNLFDKPEKWRFHNTELGSHIKNARHAMAMDEIRSSFSITRWQRPSSVSEEDFQKRVTELWFPGVHSDVGGGYAESELSDGALLWMMEESESFGLGLRPGVKNQLKPDALGVMHNSYKGAFAKLRSRPRNIDAMVPKNHAKFHQSAIDRQAHSPISNLPYHPTRIMSSGDTFSVEIFADTHWNYTGVYLEKGQRFTFSASGYWQDSKDTCDWKGTDDDKHTVGDLVRGVGTFLGHFEDLLKKTSTNKLMDLLGSKRVEGIHWFAMVGAIANDSGAKHAVNNDGSPIPHQYVDLTEHEHNEFVVSEPGYLYCFPNDAWSFYANNHGSVLLTIKCL